MLSSPPGQWTGQGASRLLRHASPLPFLRWVKVFLLECGLYLCELMLVFCIVFFVLFVFVNWPGCIRHASPLPFLRWPQVFLLEFGLYLISYDCIWVNLGQIFASVLGVYLSHIYFSCTTWHKPSLSLLNTMLAPLPCPSAQLATKFWAKVLGFFSEKIKWFFAPQIRWYSTFNAKCATGLFDFKNMI